MTIPGPRLWIPGTNSDRSDDRASLSSVKCDRSMTKQAGKRNMKEFFRLSPCWLKVPKNS